MTEKPDPESAGGGDPISERVVFAVMMASALGLLALGVALAYVFRIDLADAMWFDPRAAALGVAATAPLALMLWALMESKSEAIARFRESQLSFIDEIGISLTPPRIFLIGVAAGLSEEILFRGVLQSLIGQHAPIALAILAPNVLFGALHARTTAYAIVAGALGVYMGVLFWTTQSLWTPIIAHGVYDMIALEIARRELARRTPFPTTLAG